MSLMGKLGDDLKAAMKSKEVERIAALRIARAEIVKKQKEKAGGTITDDDVLSMLQSLIRRAEDSIEQFRKGNRGDLIEREEAQLAVLKSYLPEKLSQQEIQAIVDSAIAQTGAATRRDIGKVMGIVMKSCRDSGKLVDGNEVRTIVTGTLGTLEQS